MLHAFILANRERITALALTTVAARLAPRTAEAAPGQGLPAFMDQLLAALAPAGVPKASISENAGAHGAHLLRAGFTYAQVVHDYGSVCQAITGLAD
jgi:hypothetical protein